MLARQLSDDKHIIRLEYSDVSTQVSTSGLDSWQGQMKKEERSREVLKVDVGIEASLSTLGDKHRKCRARLRYARQTRPSIDLSFPVYAIPEYAHRLC